MAKRGWYSRGYLPHIDLGDTPQFLTWRLDDALPKSVLCQWLEELAQLPNTERHNEEARRVEAYCDTGYGSCHLRDPIAARAVQETLFHDHLIRYHLDGWAVMPNHVHVILTPIAGISLGEILRTLKSVSAQKVNKRLNRTGKLWQEDYYDRFIRDEEHFHRTMKYIEWNPVKAGLCADPKHWAWSSANPDARHRLEFIVASRGAG